MKFSFILLIAAASFFGGCGPHPSNTFYWRNYSNTLYELTKDPTDETLDAHKKELVAIFEYCEKYKKRIPPGISAEYGYILLKQGNEAEGMTYLDKEISLYPESSIFITRIKAEYGRSNNESN